MDHVQVYLAQAKTDDYTKSDDYNKFSTAYGYANRVINAKEIGDIYEKMPIDIDELMVKFNNENSGKVKLIHDNSLNKHIIKVYINNAIYEEGGRLWSKIDNPRN